MDFFYSKRTSDVLLFFGVLGAVLLITAARLQLTDNNFKQKAVATTTSKYTLYPSRGLIYDRNGELLINNNPVYDLMVTYNQINPDMDTLKFCELLGMRRSDFEAKLNKNFRSNRYSKGIPFLFLSTLSAEGYARLQESLYEFPGFFVQVRNVRGYPHGHAAHVLGYISEVSQKEVKKNGYVPGDYIGSSGLELEYEEYLRGKKGARFVFKDNMGREVSSYLDGRNDTLAVSGYDLVSTIDLNLQSYGEKLMQGKTGSIVAIEPSTGEILTMISSPTYNPNLMTINRERGKFYRALLVDSLKPLFNRAVMAKYPPGSIFKSVIGLIGSQLGVTDPYEGIHCPGYYKYNDVKIRCRNHPYPSNIGIALKHSCNTYFINEFRNIIDIESFYKPTIGLDTLNHYLFQMGMGNPLGIDFPQERNGNVPTVDYYNRLYSKNRGSWKSPTIMSLGIGQGEIEMTGMQMANLASILANRGYYYIPHLGKKYLNSNLKIDRKYLAKHFVGILPIHFDPVIEGMVSVVSSGTGRLARVPQVLTAGKTGTIQNPHGKDHSTFIAFAPADNPKIAISVYVENAGGGGTFAAPIAGLIMEKYLKGKIESERRKWLENELIDTNLNADE